MLIKKSWFLSLWVVVVITGCSTSVNQKSELSRKDRARMLIQIANGALLERDSTGALQYLQQAEQQDSNLPELYHSKAIAFYSKNNLELAFVNAKKAIEIKPDYSEGNNTLGKIYLEMGRLDEALPLLQKAASDPLNREAYKSWTNLGILEYQREDFFKAEKYFDRAISEAPLLACVSYYYRGNIKLNSFRLKESISDYSRATQKFCAHFADAHLALGLAYERNQQYYKAKKTYLEIEKNYPNSLFSEKALNQLKGLP